MAVNTFGGCSSGCCSGGAFIGFARSLRWRYQVRFFAVCLVIAGGIYLVFGTFQGPQWAGVEGSGFVLSLLGAGLRRPQAAPLLALGWRRQSHSMRSKPARRSGLTGKGHSSICDRMREITAKEPRTGSASCFGPPSRDPCASPGTARRWA